MLLGRKTTTNKEINHLGITGQTVRRAWLKRLLVYHHVMYPDPLIIPGSKHKMEVGGGLSYQLARLPTMPISAGHFLRSDHTPI